MTDAIQKITDTTKDLANSVSEIVNDRVFSPFYFYFLISWSLINWKFVYTLLFVDEQTLIEKTGLLKLDYLLQFYGWGWYSDLLWSIGHLVVFPLISAFVFVWWMTILSEIFFGKYEQHQANKRKIKRDIEYREKVRSVKQEKVIREEEFEIEKKKDMAYGDNKEFNDYLDESMSPIEYSNTSLSPSEALYKTDYEAYKSLFHQWLESMSEAYYENQADIARGK